MATVCTTWLAMSGNGAAIGIALTTTRLSRTKAALRTIPKVRIRHSILPSLMRKSGGIAVARSSATISIAHATSLARVAKARSTPAQITSGFDAFDHWRMSRNKRRKNRFLNKRRPLINLMQSKNSSCQGDLWAAGRRMLDLFCPSGQCLQPQGLIHYCRLKQYLVQRLG